MNGKTHHRWLVMVAATAAILAVGCGKKPEPTAEIERTTPREELKPPTTTETPTETREDRFAWKSEIKDVFFDYDKADLRGDARSVLQDNARILKEYPDAKVTLEGHCDERGTEEYNLALGQRRADAVKAYLGDLGVGVERLSTISYGEERPFAQGHDEAAWAQNRRVHFVIL
jgi:peptidoglycan-associated lipoprotein